jgi:hypothetical protein
MPAVTASEKMSQAAFARATGLSDIRAATTTYPALYRQIEQHRWYLGERGQDLELPEAAARWYAAVYRPTMDAVETAGLAGHFPARTKPADLYAAVCDRKWLLSERAGHDVGLTAAIADLIEERRATTGRSRQRSKPPVED